MSEYDKIIKEFQALNPGDKVLGLGGYWIRPVSSDFFHTQDMFVNLITGQIRHFSYVYPWKVVAPNEIKW